MESTHLKLIVTEDNCFCADNYRGKSIKELDSGENCTMSYSLKLETSLKGRNLVEEMLCNVT